MRFSSVFFMTNKKQIRTPKLIIGKAVEPMLVSESGNSEKRYADIIKQHRGKSYVEVKSDGYRIQVHNDQGKLRFFARSLNEFNREAYPDVLSQIRGIPSGIFDGEIVGIEDGINGFNAIKARKRESLDNDLVKKYPLQIKFFDVLNLNGNDMIDLPLYERRKTLEQYVGNVSEQWTIDESESLKEKFLEVAEQGLEGVVCKNPSSQYLIGKRTKDWIKLKKFLTLDLVVLGVYSGEGKAAELPFAALLLGTQNNGYYETITKVGIAKKDIIDKIEKKVRQFYTTEIPANIIISDSINKSSYKRKKPIYFIRPENSVVVEVEALNITKSKNWHSCGLYDAYGRKSDKAYSLRIPIVQRYRDDKTAKDIATTEQITEIYEK